MSLFTVHVPEDAPDAATRGLHTRFIREGVSRGALLFGLVYLLWHRLWVAAVAWVVLLLALVVFALVFHPPLPSLLALLALMHLYAGVEGPDLRRRSLTRRGFALRDVVSAPDLETAEALFFLRTPAPVRSAPSPVLATSVLRPAAVPAVIGYSDGDGA